MRALRVAVAVVVAVVVVAADEKECDCLRWPTRVKLGENILSFGLERRPLGKRNKRIGQRPREPNERNHSESIQLV